MIVFLPLQSAPPVLPPGLNEHFVTTAYAVEQKLALSDFDAATALSKKLPKSKIVIAWNDGNVPENRRAEFATQRDKALEQWKQVPGISFDVEKGVDPKADIAFDFTKSLPITSEGVPAGATFEFSDAAPFHVVLGLERGSPPAPVGKENVHNEVAYAVAQYIGLERAPAFNTFTARSDQNAPNSTLPTGAEISSAQQALNIADQIRTLATNHQSVTYKVPHVQLGATEVKGLVGTQGEPLGFEIPIQNAGSADLTLRVQPDCGCLLPDAPQRLSPGQTGTIRSSVNTNDFTGHLNHYLVVYSNDAQTPRIIVPVEMNIEPLFRFVTDGPSVLQMGPQGAVADLYLVLSPKAKLEPLTASVYGAKGDVTITPWKGAVPNDTATSTKPGAVYKFHVKLEPNEAVGRIPAMLYITTDSDTYKILSYTFYLQRGIIAMPGQIYLGEVPAQPAHFAFLVGRPGTPFKITGVTSEPALFDATFSANGPTEYRVEVDYNGKAPPGDFTGVISVHTDDPKQPIVKVPVRMIVK